MVEEINNSIKFIGLKETEMKHKLTEQEITNSFIPNKITSGIVSSSKDYSCWWKDGKPYFVDKTHIVYVLQHPEVFGLDYDWINKEIVAKYGEFFTDEEGDFTKATETLKEYLYTRGWIRVRDMLGILVIEGWDSNSKDFKDCVWWLYQNYKKERGGDRFRIDVESVKGKSGAYYESEIDYKYGGHELTELLSSRQIKSEYNPNNFTDSDSFWWKNGTIHNLDEVSTTHDLFVMDNPELFGFEQYKQEVVDEFGDILDENMNPTYDVKKLFDDMFERGWIRVRVWGTEITVECLNSDTKDFKECVWYIYKTFKPRTITIESKVGEYDDDYSEADGTLMELLSSRKTEMKHRLTEKEIINSLIVNNDYARDAYGGNPTYAIYHRGNLISIKNTLEDAENTILYYGTIVGKNEKDEHFITYDVQTKDGLEVFEVIH